MSVAYAFGSDTGRRMRAEDELDAPRTEPNAPRPDTNDILDAVLSDPTDREPVTDVEEEEGPENDLTQVEEPDEGVLEAARAAAASKHGRGNVDRDRRPATPATAQGASLAALSPDAANTLDFPLLEDDDERERDRQRERRERERERERERATTDETPESVDISIDDEDDGLGYGRHQARESTPPPVAAQPSATGQSGQLGGQEAVPRRPMPRMQTMALSEADLEELQDEDLAQPVLRARRTSSLPPPSQVQTQPQAQAPPQPEAAAPRPPSNGARDAGDSGEFLRDDDMEEVEDRRSAPVRAPAPSLPPQIPAATSPSTTIDIPPGDDDVEEMDAMEADDDDDDGVERIEEIPATLEPPPTIFQRPTSQPLPPATAAPAPAA
ncbi:MAG TPA: hypothetical protein VFU21_17475, partial [Kofleriaceae bacterium]|nr:hypothetical protein [Kofleriaceae bacterium]